MGTPPPWRFRFVTWPLPDAVEQRRMLTSGEVSATELAEISLTALDAVNGQLNAVIHTRADLARAEAALVHTTDRRPLAGVPVVVKDLGCGQAGEPHHHGAKFLADRDWTETDDSYLWRSLRDAGAISLGRTNTPEFGTTITTEPAAHGPTANPWNPAHSPGGSSGGSAAAVAAGIVPIAHGNDGGGSLRVPASACGLVGLKPSRGRVTVGPRAGEHRGAFAVDGVLTRTVRDTALALDVIGRPWPGDPYHAPPPAQPFAETVRSAIERPPTGLRIAVSNGGTPEVAEVVARTAVLLEGLGHRMSEGAPADWFDDEVTDQTIVIRTVAIARELDTWAARIGRPIVEGDVEDSNLWSAELGRTLPGWMYLAAQDWLAGWTRRTAAFWSEHDLLITPVLGAEPPPLGHLSDPREGQARLRELIGFVDQANVSGQPAISLPMGMSQNGLPIGVQFIAAYGREDLLLAIGAHIEQQAPWADRRPTIS
jgi:amidase